MKTTLILNPRYAHLEAFARDIPQRFEQEGTVIYRGHNLIKTFQLPDGTTLNVKRFRRPTGINLLVYSTGLRKPKGRRAYQYAGLLRERGIGTPDVIALVEQRSWLGLLGYSYLITIQVDYPHDLYEMGDARKGQYERLGMAVGAFAARLHRSQVLHKDFTPGNILWREEAGQYHFMLVDINRMAFGPVNREQGLGSLCRLWGPKDFTRIIVTTYAQDMGYDTDEAVAYVMQKRASFWRRYGRKHKIKFKLEL